MSAVKVLLGDLHSFYVSVSTRPARSTYKFAFSGQAAKSRRVHAAPGGRISSLLAHAKRSLLVPVSPPNICISKSN